MSGLEVSRNVLVFTHRRTSGGVTGHVTINDWDSSEREDRHTIEIGDVPPFVARILAQRLRDERGFTMIDFTQRPVVVSGRDDVTVEGVAGVVSGSVPVKLVKMQITGAEIGGDNLE